MRIIKISPTAIRAIRKSTGENAERFGERFARSGRTVEDWEQGRRRPDAFVLVALDNLRKNGKIPS